MSMNYLATPNGSVDQTHSSSTTTAEDNLQQHDHQDLERGEDHDGGGAASRPTVLLRRPQSSSLELENSIVNASSSNSSHHDSSHHHPDNDGVDGNVNGDVHDKKQRKPTTPFWVAARYISLSLLALGLTIFCPANETVYIYHMTYDDANVNHRERTTKPLLQCLVLYGLTIALFFSLRGTDPGYLTVDNMEDFSPDSMTLLEYEEKNDPKHNQHQQDFQDDEPFPNSMSQRRNISVEEGDIQQQQEQTIASSETMIPGTLSSPPLASFQGTTRRRYCPTCQVAPPLRSHHCKICNKCVACFDHHCDFVGTCIGERNHCQFWWFLLVQALGFTLFCHYVNSSSLGFQTLLLEKGGGGGQEELESGTVPWKSLHVVVAKLYLYPLFFFAWIMVLAHTWMAVTNSTTFECSKGTRHLEYLQNTKPFDFPFSRGLIGNLKLFCCDNFDLDQCRGVARGRKPWKPKLWQPPGKIIRDSEDWWEHPWQNKYWSCC